jgi:hypothetical protein
MGTQASLMQPANSVFRSIPPEAAARNLQKKHPDGETIPKIIERPKQMLALERARGTASRADIEVLLTHLDNARNILEVVNPVTQATVVDTAALCRTIESALIGKKVVAAVDIWQQQRLRKMHPSEVLKPISFWSTNIGKAARTQMRYDIHFDFVEHSCSPLLLKQEGIEAQEGPKRRRAEKNGIANLNLPQAYRMGVFNETETKKAVSEFLDNASSARRASGAVLRSILSAGDRDEQSLCDDHYQTFEELRYFTFEEAAIESELHKRMRREKYTWVEMKAGRERKGSVNLAFERMFLKVNDYRKKLLKRRGIKIDPDLLEKQRRERMQVHQQ